jgi:transcriptional regulator with XRE-family HTH domain
MERGGRGMESAGRRAAELAAIKKRQAMRPSAEAPGGTSVGFHTLGQTDAPVRPFRSLSREYAQGQKGGWESAGNILRESGWSRERHAEEAAQQPGLSALEREAARLGQDLRDLRTSANISRAQLARQLGWPVRKVRRIERGERLAERDEIVAWVRLTGAPDSVARELIGRAGQESLAEQEMSALAQGTAKAFIEHFVNAVLTAHQLGPAIKVIEWAHRIWQWSQVADGEGSLEIDAPIPLGSGVELDLSLHVGADPDGSRPLLTVCFAPSGDSSVGVLTFGPVQVSPAVEHATHAGNPAQRGTHYPELQPAQQDPRDRPQPSPTAAQRQGPVVVIPQDLSDVLRVQGSEERVARLHVWAETTLASEFAANPWLQLTEAGLVVVYDPDTAVVVWVRLRHSHHPSWRVIICPELTGPGAAKIAITMSDR